MKTLPDERRAALRVVWSTGGIDDMLTVGRKPHEGFRIGYIGTVDYSKLHPRFVHMSGRVAIPGAHFVVCGGPSQKQIEDEARQQGISDRFTFTGQVSDIKKYLSTFDVFGYPLAPYHYGTCEQSLGESMAAGIPPVVMANRAERSIVEDGVNGLIAADEEGYAHAVERLYHDPELRGCLAENARAFARERYSLDVMIARWENIFAEALRLPKKQRQWQGSQQGGRVSAAGLFVESLGDYASAFRRHLQAETRRIGRQPAGTSKDCSNHRRSGAPIPKAPLVTMHSFSRRTNACNTGAAWRCKINRIRIFKKRGGQDE